MHIPDGLLHPAVIAGTGVVSAGAISIAINRSRSDTDDSVVPKTGVLAAFLFVAQMIQFPVASGVSGHLLGGALATILAGPWIASLVLSTVLIIQCLVFQDGGLLALGANIFNMAVIGVFSAHFTYKILTKFVLNRMIKQAVVATASFVSVICAAAAAGIELGISGIFPLIPGLITITGIHVLIGAGEAVITVAAVAFVSKSLPEFFHTYAGKRL